MSTQQSFISEDQQDDEDLRCPSCFYFFSSITKPYILPCFHNICIKCIDKLIKENKSFCPICNCKFNAKDRKIFEVNFGFLNLVIQILKTKIIFCTKCNKIFYWKNHYNLCNQKNFVDANDILEEIKTACEDGIKILKIFNNSKIVLYNYKSDIYKLINHIVNEIHKNFEKKILIEIKKLFSMNIKIDFKKSKNEIIEFLQLCLSYPKYFDTREILKVFNIISVINPNLSSKFGSGQKKLLLPNMEIFHKNFFNTGRSGFYIKTNFSKTHNKINSIISNSYNNYDNKKESINEESDDDDFIDSNNFEDDDEDEDDVHNDCSAYNSQNKNHFNKMSKSYLPINNINKQAMKENNIYYNFNEKKLNDNNINKTATKIKIKIEKKKRKIKFDISSVLDEEIEDFQTKNKIIVGLKDIKIVPVNKKSELLSPKLVSKKIINIYNLKNEFSLDKGRKSKQFNTFQNLSNNTIENCNYLKQPKKKLNLLNPDFTNYKLSNNNNFNCQQNNFTSPSLRLLRSVEYTKRDFNMNIYSSIAANKIEKNIKNIYKNNNSNDIDFLSSKKNKNINTIFFEEKNTQNLSERNLINYGNLYKRVNPNEIKISKNNKNKSYINSKTDSNNIIITNKLLKKFNEIKDITNKFDSYTILINYLFDIIKTSTDKNLISLFYNINNNYDNLLNGVSNTFHQTQKRYLLSIVNNTNIFILYEIANKKTIKKTINCMKFNELISIEQDDNELIFISGGDINSNKFLIYNWKKNIIEYADNMKLKTIFHKNIYFKGKLYFIGGKYLETNKAISLCRFFSINNKTWNNLPNLNIPRFNVSVCIYNDSYLYVFNGKDDYKILNTIEYLDISGRIGCFKNKWKIIQPIDYGLVWNGVINPMVVTINKDKILICGGENNKGIIVKEIFLFEPSTKCIYRGIDLSIEGSFNNGLGSIRQGEVFGIGFKNKNDRKNMLHIYNIKSNSWKFMNI